MDNIENWLDGRQAFVEDFKVKTSEAEPFVFEWHDHSRPGPSYSGSEYTDYLTDGDVEQIKTGEHYDYPCFDDADFKVSVTGWSWLLLYHYRYYATDDQEWTSLTLIVKDQATAESIIPVIHNVMRFGLSEAEVSKPEDITGIVIAALDLRHRRIGFGEFKRIVDLSNA